MRLFFGGVELVSRHFILKELSSSRYSLLEGRVQTTLVQGGLTTSQPIALVEFKSRNPLLAEIGERVQLNIGPAHLNSSDGQMSFELSQPRHSNSITATVVESDSYTVQFSLPASELLPIIRDMRILWRENDISKPPSDYFDKPLLWEDEAVLVFVKPDGEDKNGAPPAVGHKGR